MIKFLLQCSTVAEKKDLVTDRFPKVKHNNTRSNSFLYPFFPFLLSSNKNTERKTRLCFPHTHSIAPVRSRETILCVEIRMFSLVCTTRERTAYESEIISFQYFNWRVDGCVCVWRGGLGSNVTYVSVQTAQTVNQSEAAEGGDPSHLYSPLPQYATTFQSEASSVCTVCDPQCFPVDLVLICKRSGWGVCVRGGGVPY